MTRDALLLIWVCFIGTVFVPINPDAAVVIYVTARHRPLLEATALALTGQLAMLALLYLLGDWLRTRSRWLARRCEQVQARWGPRLAKGSLPAGGDQRLHRHSPQRPHHVAGGRAATAPAVLDCVRGVPDGLVPQPGLAGARHLGLTPPPRSHSLPARKLEARNSRLFSRSR